MSDRFEELCEQLSEALREENERRYQQLNRWLPLISALPYDLVVGRIHVYLMKQDIERVLVGAMVEAMREITALEAADIVRQTLQQDTLVFRTVAQVNAHYIKGYNQTERPSLYVDQEARG